MIKTLVLGGGCFWGLQDLIRTRDGVISSTVGYSGGKIENPTYENHQGHAEVVEIKYDSEITPFKKLLDFFFQIHDPTTLNRQGNDIGTSYRSVIFYTNETEKKESIEFIDVVNKSKRWENPVVTEVVPLIKFTKAEEYHQDYLVKNPGGYTCHRIRFDSYL
ncbi:peptide-methionine (S)-S-oxide reductase [Candidatus Roizmanbacteria bacterium CG11_big_fil_rev_8_21_14_0_20_36_8]|uniref:Peptide methionine sulfoxide reductase MsrA n=2 Tax=Candidatus Roizmaniibacteriota TaxID=1752723 RepID=A0A2M6ITN3_9BACT|nr:MAG: peptide-methionine (S)-S-oxide reductase [Candidatus Roizmanbacteria bacterium CG11_big_fil_rev_8_21_14_0_20_36_8]PIZ65181.1 MAG: peptide-methionine (S)-S-oxide reductase [Candidatus Roizmanbacteria bacterium CG_4_10_14_0_2_um_filter_36_9]